MNPKTRYRPSASSRSRHLTQAAFVSVGATVALLVSMATATAQPAPLRDAGGYRQVAVLRPPHISGPFGLVSDIVWVQPDAHRVYLSDDTNAQVDAWDTRTNRFLGAISGGFTGLTGFPDSFDALGPDGVLVDDLGQVWAGNGDGTVKVGSVRTLQETDSIETGAANRADELAYDPDDRIIVVTDPSSAPAQVTLIGARNHRVLGHVVIPGAGIDSVEQPKWDPLTERFLVSVRETSAHPDGEIAVIDPRARVLDKVLPLSQPCNPAGMALGPGRDVLLGCDSAPPVIMNKVTGEVLATVYGACCADEVWFNRADGRYYAAEFGTPNGTGTDPVVLVIDAHSRRAVAKIPIRTSTGAPDPAFHSVAAFGRSRVYVPESDGVHVFVRASAAAG